MLAKALGRNRDPGQPELDNRAVGLFHRRVNVLEGNQTDGLQPWVLLADAGDEVVVRAGIRDRVVALDDLADREARGGEKNRDVDALGVEVAEARRNVVLLHPAELAAHAGIHPIAAHQRAAPQREWLGQVRADIGVAFDDMSVGIDYPGWHGRLRCSWKSNKARGYGPPPALSNAGGRAMRLGHKQVSSRAPLMERRPL